MQGYIPDSGGRVQNCTAVSKHNSSLGETVQVWSRVLYCDLVDVLYLHVDCVFLHIKVHMLKILTINSKLFH